MPEVGLASHQHRNRPELHNFLPDKILKSVIKTLELILFAHIKEEHLVTVITLEIIKFALGGQCLHLWAFNSPDKLHYPFFALGPYMSKCMLPLDKLIVEYWLSPYSCYTIIFCCI